MTEANQTNIKADSCPESARTGNQAICEGFVNRRHKCSDRLDPTVAAVIILAVTSRDP